MTEKTEQGKCPKCNSNVEYDEPFNSEASAQECHCPKCDWKGWESYKHEFTEMTTIE